VKKELTATWDLKASHYIETYAVPQPDQKDYPALCVAAELLSRSFSADQSVKQWAGMVLCGTDLNTPEGAYFYISASLTPGADPAKAKAQIAQQVDKLRKGVHNPRVAAVAAALAQQMRAPQDIAAALKSKPAWMTEAALVGNLGLQWGLLEFLYGDTLSAVADGLSKVSADDVVSVAAKYLSEEQRNTLLLAPRS
jgi:predicted Zn-dependent peptidase